MQRVSRTELIAFLLDRLGMRGPSWPADRAAELGMIQIDSIRVTGLRNHELAWAARTDAPPAAFYESMYGAGRFRETHYPLFAVRRDWLPSLVAGFTDFSARHRQGRRRLLPLMKRLVDHMRERGPVTAAQFTARRIPGGFNTVKATTQALEYLFYDRAVQIAGRTPNFHRIFDLTERVAPELVDWAPPGDDTYERFLLQSAVAVLKIASADQIADRVALHYGQWRGESIRRWRAMVERLLPEVACGVTVTDLPDQPVYWYLPQDEPAWHGAAGDDGAVRVVPPLDNLLFSRKRFRELFGFEYKFEAYTPESQRRFYFAMPLLHGSDIVGLVDARLDRGAGAADWQVVGLDMMKPVAPDALRAGIHRLARIAGADRVTVGTRTSRDLRRALVGPCPPA